MGPVNHTLLVEDCLSKDAFTVPPRLLQAEHGMDNVLRRHVSLEAERALQKLGHAIEHLTDELISGDRSTKTDPAVLEAVRILMALNREIYHACPVVDSRQWPLVGILRRLFAY